jgi:LysM repeat protein
LLSLRLLILLMATAAVFLLISNRVQAGVPALAPVAHRVEPGETLWELAEQVGDERDTRAVVAEIQDLNALDGATIHPGQVLLLPSPGR